MSSAAHDGHQNNSQDLVNLDIPYIPLTFDNSSPDESALQLVQAYAPEWKDENEGPVVFHRFTDGITNTLTKATKKRPGKTSSEVDQEAILLRAYGQGTDVLIDRNREIKAHGALSKRGLAPALLARFDNGLMYRFVEGDVCAPQDLRKEEVYRQVARRLGQWHAVVPITEISEELSTNGVSNGHVAAKVTPSLWTVMHQWLNAVPQRTTEQQEQKRTLTLELESLEQRFGQLPGLLGKSLVFGHCDLLSGNVIIQSEKQLGAERPVSFIDYEYATPSPAAFDIANHFAEWAGFDCDHSACPTRSVRRDFIQHYVLSFYQEAIAELEHPGVEIDMKAAITQLYDQVDACRGLPGFYWGVWSLIQAEISQIDFNYAEYAQIRLGEYWAWKSEDDGSRARDGREMPLRERRWAQQ
ncbi:hypothetical protein AMS68_007167 [Peltaster fructicola]|uniref:ethanolamine kinase n=1 Tax=Peltaster fructicola TaxID=286661 RepID=A0A6H0Y4W3_9PEZI|nr:hypothetical protein AMS68_007167 [Peltaster fructicola]